MDDQIDTTSHAGDDPAPSGVDALPAKIVTEVLDAVPPSQREQAGRVLLEYTASIFAGPLPHPNLLKKYNDCVTDGADRIIKMAERQSAHRQELEKMVVQSNCRGERIGQVCGVILAALALIGGIALIFDGKSGPGISILVGDAAVFGGAFIYTRKTQSSERTAKAGALRPPLAKPANDSKS